MRRHSFSLIPFPDSRLLEIEIRGRVLRRGNVLFISYSVTGEIQDILLPEAANHPGRRGELWRKTCFEFFLAECDQPHYWEFNLSPSGDWNVYRMDAYRRVGFREEELFQELHFSVRSDPGCLSIASTVDLNSIVEPAREVQVGITAVIQARDGCETYWSLAHPGPQADFHARDSFILALEGSGRL